MLKRTMLKTFNISQLIFWPVLLLFPFVTTSDDNILSYSEEIDSYHKARNLSDFLKQNHNRNLFLDINLLKPYWSANWPYDGCAFTLSLYDGKDEAEEEKYGFHYGAGERLCIVDCDKRLIAYDKYKGFELIQKGNQLTFRGKFKYVGDLEGPHQGYYAIGFQPHKLQCEK